MNRAVARGVHKTTNIGFWLENPDWNPGGLVPQTACAIARALPFSFHEFQKRLWFTDELIAVNGESVVAANGTQKVDKFMFRYPGNIALEAFKNSVAHEVGTVTSYLAGIALPTEVSIKAASILKYGKPLPTVTQTQMRLDLTEHRPLDINSLIQQAGCRQHDQTARDLEQLICGVDEMAGREGLYPDLAMSSGNLRHSQATGALTLIDVMPIYEQGGRLIGDTANILENTLAAIQECKTFVGQYGS